MSKHRWERILHQNSWLRPRILLVLVMGGCGPKHPVSAPSPRLERQLILTMPSDTGMLVTLGPGVPRVLDFWAPTCGPCKTSLPDLVQREKEITAHGAELRLIAVLAEDETVDGVRATLRSWGVEHDFLISRESSAARDAGVTSLPATYVLDRAATLIWSAPTPINVNDVIAALP